MKQLLAILLAAAIFCGCALAEGAPASSAEPAAAPPEIVQIPAPEEEPVTAVPEITDQPTAEPTEQPTPEPTEVLRLAGVKIGIDPGHQDHQNSDKEPIAPGSSEMKMKVLSGTAGVRTGIPEYVTNLEISMLLREELEALGATVYMTRETHDVDISNMERALMFNELNVDLAVRIHCNGAENRSVHGAGTYVRKTGEKQAESELAGELILDALCEATGASRQGVFLRDTYTGQNWSTVPCVMVETGYMSNPEEDEKLNDPAYQKLLAQGIAEGICRYIESVNVVLEPGVLKQGSRGEEVKRLQAKLIELGYLNDVADGAFGPKTAEAVRAFQQANGLEPTGIANQATRDAIYAVPSPEPEPAEEATQPEETEPEEPEETEAAQ